MGTRIVFWSLLLWSFVFRFSLQNFTSSTLFLALHGNRLRNCFSVHLQPTDEAKAQQIIKLMREGNEGAVKVFQNWLRWDYWGHILVFRVFHENFSRSNRINIYEKVCFDIKSSYSAVKHYKLLFLEIKRELENGRITGYIFLADIQTKKLLQIFKQILIIFF